MPRLERLSAADVRAAMTLGLQTLRSHAPAVNRLNVYPVPDADTGTNMTLTLEAVVRALEGAPADMRSTMRAIADGVLLGARGVSGVILAQLLRTLAERLAGVEAVGPAELADALAAAARAAEGAIRDPVEGTILTVARAAAEAATDAAGGGADLVGTLEAARAAAVRTLERTPELLPALARAGVVDAGGTGFVLLLDALLSATDGRPLPEPAPVAEPRAVSSPGEGSHDGDHRYEVACLLEAPAEVIPALREAWGRIGGAVVVVGGEGTWTCHIHTDQPGEAIEALAGFGRPRSVRVTDLVLQTVEERGLPPEPEPDHVRTAAIAVATGDGLRRLLRSFGVRVLTGSRAAAPSVGELVDAVETAHGDAVVLVLADPRFRPAAEEAAALAPRPTRVVACRSIPEQIAAVRVYDPEGEVEAVARAMAEEAALVRSGWVVRAVRDAEVDGRTVRAGEWLAMTPEGAVGAAASVEDAVGLVLPGLVGDAPEVLTVIEGEGSNEAATEAVLARARALRPDLGIQVLRGGQPHQAYALGVE
ncbi:hypothetical protein HRbin12_00675 [bacterium HR12]|nr:hypothetical protein HRbin12_00675 [bacterium HR12]